MRWDGWPGTDSIPFTVIPYGYETAVIVKDNIVIAIRKQNGGTLTLDNTPDMGYQEANTAERSSSGSVYTHRSTSV